jgi:hypothetical protein
MFVVVLLPIRLVLMLLIAPPWAVVGGVYGWRLPPCGEATQDRVKVIGKDDLSANPIGSAMGSRSAQLHGSSHVVAHLLHLSVSCPWLTADPYFDPDPDERSCTMTNKCGPLMLELPDARI